MYCHNCGTEVADTAKFCHRCGEVMWQPGESRAVQKPEAPRERRRQRGLRRRLAGCGVLLAGLILLCSAAATALYFWLGLEETGQTATVVREEETVAFAAISPSALQLMHLNQMRDLPQNSFALAPLAALPGVAQAGEMANEHLPTDLEIDPVRDILPWIGREIGIAVLDDRLPTTAGRFRRSARVAGRQGSAYSGPPLVLTAVTRNAGRTKTFLAKVRDQMEEQGTVFITEDYGGILITSIGTPSEFPLAYAVSDNLLVVATDATTLQQALDNVRDLQAPVLRNSPKFQAMLDSLPANRLGYVYAETPRLLRQLNVASTVWQLDTAQYVGLSVALNGDGLRFDYALDYDTTQLSAAQEEWLRLPASENRFTEQLPADCLFYVSGQNLPLLLETFTDVELRDLLNEAEEELGVNVWDGMVELTGSEYAVAAIEDRHGLFGDEVPVSVLLFAAAEDPRRVGEFLQRLGTAVAQSGQADFYEEEINRVPVWLLEDNADDATLGYGVLGNNVFIGTSYDILRAATLAQNSSLSDSRRFKVTTDPLPRQQRNLLYIDIQQSLRVLERVGELEAIGDEEWDLVRSVEALSLSVEPLDAQGNLHGVLFLMTGG